MPMTYTMDTIREPASDGESVESVKAAKRTGAQHDEVIPEKTPRIYVETTFVSFASGITRCGTGNIILMSSRVISPIRNMTNAPKRYTVVWKSLKNDTINLNPTATGIRMVPNPKANIKVRKTTRFFSLNIVPK